MVVDGKETEVGPGERTQLLVAHSGQAALGVLHHHRGVHPENAARKSQAPQHVVGHPAPGVADHVGLPEVQAQHGEDVDACVHAGDDGEPASGPRVVPRWHAAAA